MADLTVSREIARQLGNIALSMMGAKHLTGDENSLSFRIGGGAKSRATHVTITLDANDTYEVELLRCSVNRGRELLDRASGIYVENLRRTLEEMTGFCLSL